MIIQIDKKEMIDSLKNVEIKGKWATTTGIVSKSLGKYIHFQVQDNLLLLANADESTAICVALSLDEETEEGSFVLEINTLYKYLTKMNDTITLEVGETVVMKSDGKRATMPMVVEHPFHGNLTRLVDRWPLDFDEDLSQVISLGVIDVRCGVQVTGRQLQDAISACKIVNSGLYKLDYRIADDISNAKFTISSEEVVSSFKEEINMSQDIGESSTVYFSGPLHKAFAWEQKINIFIGDDQPIIMLAENTALIRAARLGA